jgi:hypothetical protein
MTEELAVTFDVPPELRAKVDEIIKKYHMALPFQMAEELFEAGLETTVVFHIVVRELRVHAARMAVMACEIEKREPRLDLWMQRAEEDIADAKVWLADMQKQEKDEEVDRCPVCAEAFQADDICAVDIELGVCHAACLEGSPTVDLDTGEPVPGSIPTFRYGEFIEPKKPEQRS